MFQLIITEQRGQSNQLYEALLRPVTEIGAYYINTVALGRGYCLEPVAVLVSEVMTQGYNMTILESYAPLA